MQKNNAIGTFNETQIEAGFFVFTYQNKKAISQTIKREVDSSLIQFHFCLKGGGVFYFNQGSYAVKLPTDQSLLLYNPNQNLPIYLDVQPSTRFVVVLISIKKFHSLFSQEADFIPFLRQSNKNEKYYKNETITPAMAVVLHAFFAQQMHTPIKALFFKGKVYELLSIYFNKEDANTQQCPFLVDEMNVMKIRKAKEIMVSRIAEPPTLQELAHEIDLSLKKLKEGFKQIYGDSVFSFLLDYKLEMARKLLDSGSYNVNEVGLKVGYSTASHFIAAFKKKYGTTPKKYILSKNTSI